MKLDRRTVLGTAAALSVFALSGALAQDKMVLKSADVHPVGYPTVAAVESLGKKLSEATDGRLTRRGLSLDAARRREGDAGAGAGRRRSP